ncbi:LysM peptidoglycan-binding domain-containing protein [Actinomycetaceae bacterium L2_0104]
MDDPTPAPRHPGAISIAALVASACCLLASWHSLSTPMASSGTQALTQAVIGIAGLVGALSGLWVALSYAVLARARRDNRVTLGVRIARRIATPGVRRALAGLSVSSTLLVSPALADPIPEEAGPDLGWAVSSSTSVESWAQSENPEDPDLGFSSASTTRSPTPSLNTTLPSSTHTPDSNPSDSSYTVIPGDTLWSIADDHLREGASSADIALAADAWFRANADHILDPDLIYPGQLLISPEETP